MNTLEQVKASQKTFLTPADVAPILGTDPQTVRVMARQKPELLGFPFTFSGCHMKIPRIPFLRFFGVEVDEECSNPGSPDQHESRELIASHTFKKESDGVLWEISIRGWKYKA